MCENIYMLTNYDLEELCEFYDVPLRGIYMKATAPLGYEIIVWLITIRRLRGLPLPCVIPNAKDCGQGQCRRTQFYVILYICTCYFLHFYCISCGNKYALHIYFICTVSYIFFPFFIIMRWINEPSCTVGTTTLCVAAHSTGVL